MARKNVVKHQLEEAKSLASDFTTSATTIRYLDNCAYQINVDTADSTGTFTVQGSIDYQENDVGGGITNPGSWCVLALTGVPLVNAQNDVILIDLNQLPFNAIRLVYTAGTPGTGLCSILVMARQLGG